MIPSSSPIELWVAGEALADPAAPPRLDRWLADQLPDLSRSRIQQLIEDAQVCVNGQVCTRKKQTVAVGDRITLTIPDVTPATLKPQAIPLDILYEDASLIILNKPAGMVVHPSAGHAEGTLVNALLAHCGSLPGIGGVERPGIVHRLDKDTTGAIVVAKTDQALQHLQAQIRAKTARREYLAVVYGAPQTSQGTIDQPIGRHPVDRQKMGIVSPERGGRQAVTYWTVKERLGNYTLMHFQLETGRTHQIRVHSSDMGHPIVGDTTYGAGRSVGVKLTGQALHAWKLILQHPVSGDRLEAIAPLPPEFQTLLTVLRQRCRLSF
ncbi:MAG: RluA family pseudouridine synthase [Synechococcales bacterium]|nr:RluA family pseudouridine synthase [Synechococcales bacterium]